VAAPAAARRPTSTTACSTTSWDETQEHHRYPGSTESFLALERGESRASSCSVDDEIDIRQRLERRRSATSPSSRSRRPHCRRAVSPNDYIKTREEAGVESRRTARHGASVRRAEGLPGRRSSSAHRVPRHPQGPAVRREAQKLKLDLSGIRAREVADLGEPPVRHAEGRRRQGRRDHQGM